MTPEWKYLGSNPLHGALDHLHFSITRYKLQLVLELCTTRNTLPYQSRACACPWSWSHCRTRRRYTSSCRTRARSGPTARQEVCPRSTPWPKFVCRSGTPSTHLSRRYHQIYTLNCRTPQLRDEIFRSLNQTRQSCATRDCLLWAK